MLPFLCTRWDRCSCTTCTSPETTVKSLNSSLLMTLMLPLTLSHRSSTHRQYSLKVRVQSTEYTEGSDNPYNLSPSGKGHGLTITPHGAGHMVGGTIWKIVKDGEEVFIYAVDYNHKKERSPSSACMCMYMCMWGNVCIIMYVVRLVSIPSGILMGQCWRACPDHTSSSQTPTMPSMCRQGGRREIKHFSVSQNCHGFHGNTCFLLANILKTLRSNGNILIAVDTAGRVLELSQLLVSV